MDDGGIMLYISMFIDLILKLISLFKSNKDTQEDAE